VIAEPAKRRLTRRFFLLSLAILVPSTAVILLGARAIVQDRELDDKHRADAHRRAIADIKEQMNARLELARRAEIAAVDGDSSTYGDSIITFVGRIDSSAIIPGWSDDPSVRAFARLHAQSPFTDLIAAAQRQEQRSDTASAESLYIRARSTATNQSLAAFAELQASRLVSPTARIARLTRLLDVSLANRDEFGVPLALYAARELDRIGERSTLDHAQFIERADRELIASRTLSPTTCYLLRALHERTSETQTAKQVAARCKEIDEIESALPVLHKALASTRSSTAPTWTWIPDRDWFAFTAHARDHDIVILVRGSIVVRSLPGEYRAAQLVATRDEGEALGSPFFGVTLSIGGSPDVGESAPIKGWFYGAGLLLVIGLATTAALLVWRDVQRESELLNLRAQFVSSVSHELKTPLTAIRMYADTLLIHDDANPKMRAEYLGTIVGESERLTRLLDNVLDFSRIERGGRTYQMRDVDLTEVVRRAANTLRHALTQNGFTLALSFPNAPIMARVDADAIEQSLLNLLVNAMKYSGMNRSIALSLDVRGGEAVLSVTDQGVGIAADHRDRIFEAFYRVPRADIERQPGAGLGLTIVRHAVEASGGRVVVDSVVGRGSTFAIHLPTTSIGDESVAGRLDGATAARA
jgi:signal transduction histidine kinase